MNFRPKKLRTVEENAAAAASALLYRKCADRQNIKCLAPLKSLYLQCAYVRAPSHYIVVSVCTAAGALGVALTRAGL